MTTRAHRPRFVIGLLLTFLVTGVVPAAAGVQFPDDRDHANIGLQLSFRSWSIDDKTTGESKEVRQFATRLMATVDIIEALDLVVYTAGGYSQDRHATVDEISGLADTKVKAFGYLWDDQLVLSLGVNIPTGITGLNDEQVSAVQAVSSNVLGFRMRDYGTGTNVDLAASLGFDVGRGWTVGGGLSYLARSEYDFDTETRYDPGQEFAATIGADWRNGRFLLSLDGLYRTFGDDKLGDAGTFSDGDQIEAVGRAFWRDRKWGADGFLRYVYKQESAYTWFRPATDTSVNNGNNLWLTLSPYYQPHSAVAVRLLLEYVTVDQALQQALGAWSVAYGLGVDVRLGRNAILELRATKLDGRSEDDTVDLSGYNGLMSIQWQF